MNPTTWHPEDGQLLQNLRLKAGIDSHIFARSNTLSHAQLLELETGVGHYFYSDLIKRHAGVRLLQKLGHELSDPVPQNPETVLEDLAAVPALPPIPMSPLLEQPQDFADIKTSSASSNTMIRSIYWIGGLCGIVLVVFLGLQQQAPSPDQRIQAVLTTSENVPPKDPTQSAPQIGEALQKTPKIETPSLSSNPASDGTPFTAMACEDKHRLSSTAHAINNPLKPGNFVYIEALADSVLCVLDGDNKLSTLTLKAGMNQTVKGLAPFLLHTNNWQGLQVFFQGRLVRTELAESSHLLLNSLPF